MYMHLLLAIPCAGVPDGSVVKNLPVNVGDEVQSLGWEDPLEKEMATHFSVLAWEIPRTEETSRLQSMGLQRVRHQCTCARTCAHTHTHT